MKRMIVSLAVFAGMFVGAGVPNAQAGDCSNASLHGTYGFFVSAVVLPDGTPRSILGRFIFDGEGSFTNTLTINDNGMVVRATDSGTYTVNADCTGQVFTNGGTRTIDIVLVNDGNEFYQLRTDDASILFMSNAAKKQFSDDNQGNQAAAARKNSR